jgi:hypothetical protein
LSKRIIGSLIGIGADLILIDMKGITIEKRMLDKR